ncbi:hypothetical protein Pelo_16024 [Pelomyxa schiedti]|nr:hypothetical protein Pelo_16024 [Pelomyxa schiedti]
MANHLETSLQFLARAYQNDDLIVIEDDNTMIGGSFGRPPPSSPPPSQSCSASPTTTKDQTYAHSQFIALGVGVIVGRCGCASPASVLTPSSLSLIGRDWVVIPERHVVVELKADRRAASQYVKFGVSPTLGLTSRPEIVDFSSGRWDQSDRKFCGWVGPDSAADRFALLTWENLSEEGARHLCVLDMKTGRRVAALVTDSISEFDSLSSTRRWAVTAKSGGDVLSLWNFDHVDTGEVKAVEGISLPDAPSEIAIDGDFLVIIFRGLRKNKRMLITADLPSTLAIGALGNYKFYYAAFTRLWCWHRTMYSLDTDSSLLCVTTGESTELPLKKGFTPIGGPYYAVKNGSLWEIYSVVEPTKLVCRHRADRGGTIQFGQELVVKEPGMTTKSPNHIEVIDAVSGFVIFRMCNSMSRFLHFIALGVGVIVGRCGCSSPASALTPSSLSTLGREWIVFPSKHVVIGLSTHKYVKFSVSPTLGLVDLPTVLDLGSPNKELRGWVGPNRTGSRFALVLSSALHIRLCVVDTSGSGAEIAATALVDCDSVISTRMWAVVVPWREPVMTLWNFDRVEVGRVEEASGIALPWAAERMVIDGDHLVVAPKVTEQPLGVVVVDLPATMESKRLAISQHIATSTHGSFWRLWSWNQRVYATLVDDSLMCVSSGERTIYPQSSRLAPIGGPYFSVFDPYSDSCYIYSAAEPEKLCCRHTTEGLHKYAVIFGQEVAVKGPWLGQNRFAVVDAVSGFVIFKIPNNSEELIYVAEVLAH